MNGAKSLLQDLDDAIARGTDESRAKALWHATDILITGRYSDDEISMFGEVIGRLADEIEVAARAQLSELMSACDHAPLNVIEKLAPSTTRSTWPVRCCATPAVSTRRCWSRAP
ncbi:uncharacterized protein (DUF2336 family) [Bradyrhizobium sp. i1.3.1]